MSPLEIDIMMHYYVSAVDYRDLHLPVINATLQYFLRREMLKLAVEPDCKEKFKITEKGRFYCKTLCSIDVPIVDFRTITHKDAQARQSDDQLHSDIVATKGK